MIVPANTRVHTWKAPHGGGSFRPNGRIQTYGTRFEPNPIAWGSDEPMQAARIFVGFNVGAVPTWSVADLANLVERVRRSQKRSPDASFLIQKGIYTSKITGETVHEDGAQVVILNVDGVPSGQFVRDITALADAIVHDLEQEEVVVEIQEGGVTKKTFGVVPE